MSFETRNNRTRHLFNTKQQRTTQREAYRLTRNESEIETEEVPRYFSPAVTFGVASDAAQYVPNLLNDIPLNRNDFDEQAFFYARLLDVHRKMVAKDPNSVLFTSGNLVDLLALIPASLSFRQGYSVRSVFQRAWDELDSQLQPVFTDDFGCFSFDFEYIEEDYEAPRPLAIG